MDAVPPTPPPTPPPSDGGSEHGVEDRLRAVLRAGSDELDAVHGAPVADLAGLARRRARHHRRQRAGWSAAAAAIVVVAALGGWAVGRDDDPDAVEQVVGPTTTTTAAGTPATTSAGVAVPPGVVVGTEALPVVSTTTAGGFRSPSESSPVVGWEGTLSLPSVYSARPAVSIFDRTLPDGTFLDVRGNAYDPFTQGVPPFWDPPGWCFPAGDVYVGARLPEAVGQATGIRYDEVAPGTLRASTTVTGTPEGHPQWITLGQGPPGTARIRVSFPGGGSDEMEPVDGLVVLTAAVAEGVDLTVVDTGSGDQIPPLHVEAIAEDGTTLVEQEVDIFGTPLASFEAPPMVGAECVAPRDLPAPGAEQPADPATAEAAIRQVWDEGFAHPGTQAPGVQEGHVDDARGLTDAMAQVARSYDAEFLSTVTIPIDGLVFADAGTAYVEYSVQVGELDTTYADRFAELDLVDGAWKVTRQSACHLLALGGGVCAPVEGG